MGVDSNERHQSDLKHMRQGVLLILLHYQAVNDAKVLLTFRPKGNIRSSVIWRCILQDLLKQKME